MSIFYGAYSCCFLIQKSIKEICHCYPAKEEQKECRQILFEAAFSNFDIDVEIFGTQNLTARKNIQEVQLINYNSEKWPKNLAFK